MLGCNKRLFWKEYEKSLQRHSRTSSFTCIVAKNLKGSSPVPIQNPEQAWTLTSWYGKRLGNKSLSSILRHPVYNIKN